ncbi:MAG: FkbM family methyltransferase [Hellea sp.]|nr:FkbM family methyltransferase [Hellea sp.]
MARDLNPPFGTYALPEARETIRRKSEDFKDTRWGRTMISLHRRRAIKELNEPFDVKIAPNVNARLYPSQNRCEKRAIAGVQIWDTAERAALKQSIDRCEDETYIFLDVGANVGLYSLFVASYCKEADKAYDIVAVEPGKQIGERLLDNINASDAKIKIIHSAVSDHPGTGQLGGGETNRGETKLLESGEGEIVIIDTIARIALAHGLEKIHAMKLDIEGHDLKALTGFFAQAPKSLFPVLLILETGKEENSPLIDLCNTEGYALAGRHGLNTIMTLKE